MNNFKNQIIKETDAWVAVNKPAGLIVERNPFESPTVESLIWDYLSQHKRDPFIGIVHRLDRVTSGVLILAKKKSALKRLNEQFQKRLVRKAYLALVEKEPPEQKGVLQHWLVKDQKNKRAVIYDKKVKNSVVCRLTYRILEKNSGSILLEIHPSTGKFHQIRAQLAHIGSPIVGDEKYGAQVPYRPLAIALHAWKLEIKDPETSESFLLETSIPKGFKEQKN